MAATREIPIPDAKPAFELIDGRLCQKVSPRYDHAALQGYLVSAMRTWARSGGHGRVGTEWQFFLGDPERGRNAFVPDVAYLSYERLPRGERDGAQVPRVAPDVAVEILAPSDWRSQVDRKVTVYLIAGTRLVIEVDPAARTLRARGLGLDRVYRVSDVFEHPAMPGFRLDLAALFDELED